MIETLIYAGVILIAAFYEKLFKEPENIAKSLRLYILLVIVWSFFRLTMLCFLFPALLVEITTKKKNILWVICKYALLILGTTVFLWFLSASFPWSFIGQWLRSSQKINFFLRHGFSSAFRFLLPTIGDPLEVALRYLYLAWSLTLLIKFLKSIKTEGNGKFYLLGHLLVLTSHLIFVFFFYDFDELRGFRMLAPILAFSLFASLMNHPLPLSKKISFGASFFVWMVFIILAIPQRDSLFKETVLRRLEPIHKSEIFQSVKYTENAHDRWENTVYVDLFIYPDMNYAHFTPGLGMMVFRVDELEGILTESPPDILKAKYLISSSDIFFPGYKKMASDMDISLYQKIKD
ncbi:MAG: hypothetical protein VB108_03550 [Anaerolineaceae bacterium]|nr:hypothetical protein [Anaerolineaceae bacterium]